MSGVLLSLVLAMEIRAAGNCPTGTDIERRLTPLLAPGYHEHTSDVATIQEGTDGALTVLLDDEDGGSIAHRRLPPAATCGDLAEAVAVTIAAWEAQIHPEISLRLERLMPPSVAPAPAAPPRAVGASPVTSPAPIARQEAPHELRTPLNMSAGVAVMGDFQSGAVAPAVRVEAGLGPAARRWQGSLAVSAVGAHSVSVPPGDASWWRVCATLGLRYDLVRASHWAAVVAAGGVAGVASIYGAGYSVDHGTRSLDAGVEALARVEWRPSRIRPWAGVLLVTWLRAQDLEVQGAGSRTLPRLEPMAALGGDFVW